MESAHLFTHQTPQLSEHICMMTCTYLWGLYIQLCAPARSVNHTGDRKLTSRAAKTGRGVTFFFAVFWNTFLSGCDAHNRFRGGLGWYLLALCVVILYQVLEEVHSFLGLNLIYFDQVLQSKERSRVQPGVDIQGVFKGFFGLMRYNVAELLLRGKKRLLLCHRRWRERTLCIMIIASGCIYALWRLWCMSQDCLDTVGVGDQTILVQQNTMSLPWSK